ncbi:succinyldiaminopimelate transaminase [Bifidobacterium subtile]|jgi:succinyldiaminopimelate transaminase|uniref:N-succinyldiaminopimelate aminotransferase n=1 Tax=Bifidobacterium subtile TaxID=77635 RepID=A0A087EBU4_9BIFI|nr:succinyldiaminopimelate transaminase [Bifidobacterium subtile]KFJ05245.1 N-succinyldiaminopimelate aminotransferase [Bifidobacterium subtile]QOL36636.1 succinyldiaminopimelate transaminase [Bifidobacterium subtile]
MGFHTFQTPYDWGRLDECKTIASQVEGGMIDLSVGSPVDPVPESVRQALAGAADAPNAHGYPATIGTPALRTAIADWFLNCRGIDLRPINAGLVPTVGSKEAVAMMASLLHLGEGDLVVQPRISYPTYEIGTQLAGAGVLKVDDVSDVESWKNTPGVRAIWVNSPCNPSGEVLSAAQLTSIVAAARQIGAVVLSDECYALMSWCADASPSALGVNVCAGSAEGILVLYSLSKQSNMAGYRTAFIAGDKGIIDEMSVYRKQIGQIISGPVQAAMVAALRDTTAVFEQRKRYQQRLAKLVKALGAYGYEVKMPAGALYIWVRALSGGCWQDIEDLARRGILVSPGEFYGAPDFLRISSTATDEAIDEAVARLLSH